MTPLSKKTCTPCKKGTPPLEKKEIETLLSALVGWKINDLGQLEKEYKFPNFQEALLFTNRIGALAEQEGHHPDLLLSYGKVKIILWTHKIQGLTENDFILAAKCDETPY
jgi:4a-hydroxytetrahydrobiopterin dehydratase